MAPGSDSPLSPTQPPTSKSTGDLTANEGSANPAATWTEKDELRLAELMGKLEYAQTHWSAEQELYHEEVCSLLQLHQGTLGTS